MVEAYPLTWPEGYKRTKYPIRARFKSTFGKARDEVIKEIRMLGGTGIIISTNIPIKQDGMPYANWERKLISDKGIAVYFTYNKEPVVFCCDKWDRLEDNMQAIGKSINSIRGLERWGVSEMLNRIFTGFEALPQSNSEKWNVVLGVNEHSPTDEVKRAYRNLVLTHHPDKGGSSEQFHKINEAWETYLKTLKP